MQYLKVLTSHISEGRGLEDAALEGSVGNEQLYVCRGQTDFPPIFLSSSICLSKKNEWEMCWRPADFRNFWMKWRHFPWSKFFIDRIQTLCQMGWNQHLCSQREDFMFITASSSEIQNKSFGLEFKISYKVGPLRNSAFNITRKEFYSFSKLARVLIFIEIFHTSWCDFVIKMVERLIVLPLHTAFQYPSKRKCHCWFLWS